MFHIKYNKYESKSFFSDRSDKSDTKKHSKWTTWQEYGIGLSKSNRKWLNRVSVLKKDKSYQEVEL